MVSELGVESTVSMVGYVEGVTADDVGKSGPFDMGSMDVAIRPFGFAGVRPLEVGTTISLVGDYNNDDGLEEQESTDTRPHPLSIVFQSTDIRPRHHTTKKLLFRVVQS